MGGDPDLVHQLIGRRWCPPQHRRSRRSQPLRRFPSGMDLSEHRRVAPVQGLPELPRRQPARLHDSTSMAGAVGAPGGQIAAGGSTDDGRHLQQRRFIVGARQLHQGRDHAVLSLEHDRVMGEELCRLHRGPAQGLDHIGLGVRGLILEPGVVPCDLGETGHGGPECAVDAVPSVHLVVREDRIH